MDSMGITPQQFRDLQRRLSGTGHTAQPVFEPTAGKTALRHQVILGVDPSLRGTGYGIIQLATPVPKTLAHGTIACPANWERSRCLAKILQSLREVLKQHQPTIGIVEGLF